MLIGIDGNEANVKQRAAGVNEYSFEILWSIYRLLEKDSSKNKVLIFLKNKPISDLPKEASFWKYIVLPGGGLWILSKLMPHLLFRIKLDVFFSPSHYLPLLTRCPKVCTIHDLGYLSFSGQFNKYDYWQLKYWSAISIIISKYIIAVSESTRKDIVRHHNQASIKTRVILHGLDKNKFKRNISSVVVRRILNKYKLKQKNYILFLGRLKPSKNIEGLIHAFNILKARGLVNTMKLVIAGKKGWLFDPIYKIVDTLGLKEDVIFTGFVEDDEKPTLKMAAKLFALPSFWEGFGMDALEALACGTPVVVSKVASLPEVAGKAGIYIDPDNPKDIADGIAKILNLSPIEYNKLSVDSVKQASKFSWVKAGQQTLNIIIKAAS